MKTLIGIQDQYIVTVNTGFQRWSHRKDGRHSSRIARGARRKAERQLTRLVFTDAQVRLAVQDARAMASLIREFGE